MANNRLWSIGADGTTHWCIDPNRFAIVAPDSEDGQPPASRIHSLPTLVGSDAVLLLTGTAVRISANGGLTNKLALPLLDDSGPSPSLDRDGDPILSTIDGTIVIWRDSTRVTLCCFGYDLVPPAVYDDGTLAVSSYARFGFCRVTTDGKVLWANVLKDADLPPTIDAHQRAAVGSINLGGSVVVAPDGSIVGSVDVPAVFATHPQGWVALARDSVSLLDVSGSPIWAHRVAAPVRWGAYKPIVDSEGSIYLCHAGGIQGLTAAGKVFLRKELNETPGPLFPVCDGAFAYIHQDSLWRLT